MYKDLGLIKQTANELDLYLHLNNTSEYLFGKAVEPGNPWDDFSVIYEKLKIK